jgi:hypothetical protein
MLTSGHYHQGLFGFDALADFFPVHGYFARCLDRQLDRASTDANHTNTDVVANTDDFALSPRKY